MSTHAKANLKLALFVEGSRESLKPTDPLELLWRRDIVAALGLRELDRVIGISKGNLVAMDLAVKGLRLKTSSIQVPLDHIMRQEHDRDPYDVAVVAWDLQPPWNGNITACRWNELKSLYRGLASSTRLGAEWVGAAKARLAELESRSTPTRRLVTPIPKKYETLAVWMRPDFEGLIAIELGIREALGIRGLSVRDWPNDWHELGPRRMDDVLDRAIEAARRHRPKPKIFRALGLPFRSAKHAWASLLIQRGGASMMAHMTEHTTGLRLRELLLTSG
jgi:hypothetical protein